MVAVPCSNFKLDMPLEDFYEKLEDLKSKIDLVWIMMGTALILLMNFGLMLSEVGSIS